MSHGHEARLQCLHSMVDGAKAHLVIVDNAEEKAASPTSGDRVLRYLLQNKQMRPRLGSTSNLEGEETNDGTCKSVLYNNMEGFWASGLHRLIGCH